MPLEKKASQSGWQGFKGAVRRFRKNHPYWAVMGASILIGLPISLVVAAVISFPPITPVFMAGAAALASHLGLAVLIPTWVTASFVVPAVVGAAMLGLKRGFQRLFGRQPLLKWSKDDADFSNNNKETTYVRFQEVLGKPTGAPTSQAQLQAPAPVSEPPPSPKIDLIDPKVKRKEILKQKKAKFDEAKKNILNKFDEIDRVLQTHCKLRPFGPVFIALSKTISAANAMKRKFMSAHVLDGDILCFLGRLDLSSLSDGDRSAVNNMITLELPGKISDIKALMASEDFTAYERLSQAKTKIDESYNTACDVARVARQIRMLDRVISPKDIAVMYDDEMKEAQETHANAMEALNKSLLKENEAAENKASEPALRVSRRSNRG